MPKTGNIEGKICKVINIKPCKPKFNSSNFYFCIKLDDKNKYTGFVNHELFDDDIISGIIDYSQTKSYYEETEYRLIKPIVKLPEKKSEQIKRIHKLFVDNNFAYYKDTEIEKIFGFISINIS
jgi:hypothetical protein